MSNGSAELSSADRIIVHVEDAIIVDPEGNEIDIAAIEVEDDVMLLYDGGIAESYPAQVWCIRVQLMD